MACSSANAESLIAVASLFSMDMISSEEVWSVEAFVFHSDYPEELSRAYP